ncbi:hypothetical protein GOODEAATRI_019787 [Goodea atripinnis]|uniref:Uncharacterized protein n=1 Tax=Goodea atripinnis TaxID=208336 RepID=A0ABV0NW27_9TELE
MASCTVKEERSLMTPLTPARPSHARQQTIPLLFWSRSAAQICQLTQHLDTPCLHECDSIWRPHYTQSLSTGHACGTTGGNLCCRHPLPLLYAGRTASSEQHTAADLRCSLKPSLSEGAPLLRFLYTAYGCHADADLIATNQLKR